MDVSYDRVSVDRYDRIAVVTLNHPESANTLTGNLVAELVHALDRLAETDVRAVVLTGTDGYFSSGADIPGFDMSSADAIRGELFDGKNPYHQIEQFDRPVIAAVNGVAFAGGFELALVCDSVIVGEEVDLGLPEATLGIVPGVAMLRLTENLGRHRAMEFMLTGETTTGAEAIEMGLFNRAVPREQVLDEATALAEQIADNAPIAVSIIKKTLNREFGGDYAINELALGAIFGTDDVRRGKDAFLSDEEPEFKGT